MEIIINETILLNIWSGIEFRKCFSILVLGGPPALHVLDISRLRQAWFEWSARHRALLKPDKDPLIWGSVLEQGNIEKHTGQGPTQDQDRKNTELSGWSMEKILSPSQDNTANVHLS